MFVILLYIHEFTIAILIVVLPNTNKELQLENSQT